MYFLPLCKTEIVTDVAIIKFADAENGVTQYHYHQETNKGSTLNKTLNMNNDVYCDIPQIKINICRFPIYINKKGVNVW